MSQYSQTDMETDQLQRSPNWRILEHFEAKAGDEPLRTLRDRLPRALDSFPALAFQTVNVGILYENADAQAQAFGYNRLLCLPPDTVTSNVTLWHELGHVAIRVRYENGEDVPRTSEEFCSIFSVARMDPMDIDEERIPYLGKPTVKRETWPQICREALRYRENHHDYIQQCKQWLGIVDGGEG